MNVRFAACEPCRRAKIACDHGRPCTRCRMRGEGDQCSYRERPFRRRTAGHHASRVSRPSRESPTFPATKSLVAPVSPVSPDASPTICRYPNPGYLGTSSHSTLFSKVSNPTSHVPGQDDDSNTPAPPLLFPLTLLEGQAMNDRATNILAHLARLDVPNLHSLVRVWLNNGVNLSLGEPLVCCGAEAVLKFHQMLAPLVRGAVDDSNQLSHHVNLLFTNSQKKIVLTPSCKPHDFLSQMIGGNLRWETIGIFLTAAARACLDISFPPLYSTEGQRRVLVKNLTFLTDFCLTACLALDALNDVQLILQYEDLVVHSQVHGDQSYHSWRRMGDITSSLFALGYHENLDQHASEVPPFIVELRKACFARVYALDKNLAVFFGRPPRIVEDYCHFQVPTKPPQAWCQCGFRRETSPESETTEQISYTADTRYAALFARVKEEILLLSRNRNNVQHNSRKASEIRDKVNKQWEAMPTEFHLTKRLKECNQGPFELDFLATARLDYLHTLFLLNLFLQEKMSEPDEALLSIANEMLSYVLEIIILRDCLVNSGTSLTWKVVQFGLPSAGVISLALLGKSIADPTGTLRVKLLQNLSVFASEISMGAWMHAGIPTFALFSKAVETIQSVLESPMIWRQESSSYSEPQQENQNNPLEDYNFWHSLGSCDFEIDFWAQLAEHPTLNYEAIV